MQEKQESQQRYLQRIPKEKGIFFEQRLFMISMINYFHKQKERLPQPFLEQMFMFLNINSILFSWYFSRSALVIALSSMYCSACILIYGEYIDFNKSLQYDLPQSLYTRSLFHQKFNDNKYQSLNQEFIQRYKLS